METKTPRQQVRAWIRDRIAEESSVQLPTMYRELIEHFAAEPEFVKAWLAETLSPVAYEETRRVCADTRGGSIVWGDVVLSRDASDARMKAARPRWQAWLEYVGDRHVRLWDMTATDLLAAAKIRRDRGESEIRLAELWVELRGRLTGRKKVGDVFSAEQIDELAASLNIDISVRRQIIVREDLAA